MALQGAQFPYHLNAAANCYWMKKYTNKMRYGGSQQTSSLELSCLWHRTKRLRDLQHQNSFLLNASVLWSCHPACRKVFQKGKAKPYILKKIIQKKRQMFWAEISDSGIIWAWITASLGRTMTDASINQIGRAVSLRIKSSGMTSARDKGKQTSWQ